MSKKKTTQTNTQANTFQYMTPPPTPAVEELKQMKATIDPSIAYSYAQQRNDLANSYNNPLGAATTPAIRDAAMRIGNERLGQAESQAIQKSKYDADNTNFGRTAAVAGMTAPQLVQTGGTSTGTQSQSGGFWGDLLTGAVGGASSNAALL